MDLVGHRIVHGGPHLRETTLITAETKRLIENAAPFAPLHNRIELEGINLCEQLFPQAQQIAVFDTSFHRTMPQVATLYPGPYEWAEKGIFRYGFHGINHQYIARHAALILHRDLNSLKIVTCHLGNGCSLAAISNGASVDTTMGFTPLDGLMMGTRSGAIDPGIVIYLARQYHLSPQQIDTILNHESGLLGISGHSSDMREIVGRVKEGDTRSQLAFDMFVHVLCKGIASMAAAINGIDVLVFTAGIGENSPDVREAACKRLSFLGIKIDPKKNISAEHENELSTPDSSARILKLRAQEDWAIAQECFHLLPSEKIQ
ncbi:MAG TPA: acetate/propionate family kinase [Candidatus Kapabacteria bacterium]|nr:acetate/propionate family kinase [Candidatus Kapabacteria bacterium]